MSEHIRLLEAGEFFWLSVLLLALCVGGAVGAFMGLRRARLIEDMPTSRIRSAAQGYVELSGAAQSLPGEAIVAPLTGKLCTWWRYSIQERRSTYTNGKRSTHWVTIDKGVSQGLFQLIDSTGDCVVDPDGASVIPSSRIRWYGHSARPISAPGSSPLFGLGRYRYVEERISDGQPLHALGWFRTEGGLADRFDQQEDVRQLVGEWKADRQRMLSFDANADGEIDLQEWEALRAAALQEVERMHLERASDPGVHVLARPPDRRLFLLSTVSEENLVRRYRRQALAGLLAFFAGGSVFLWALTERGLLT